jgi:hypothetical protein
MFKVFPGSRFDYAQILKSRSYVIWFKSAIPAANNNFSEIITSESLVGLTLMGSRRKAEIVGYNVVLKNLEIAFKMEPKSNISASSDVHHISIEATSNFIPFYSP